jgi:hypothetical protein
MPESPAVHDVLAGGRAGTRAALITAGAGALIAAWYVWHLSGQPPLWAAIWLIGFLGCVLSWWSPGLAIAGYGLTLYATPRYSGLYDALVRSALLHWEVAFGALGTALWILRRRRPVRTAPAVMWPAAAFFAWVALAALLPRSGTPTTQLGHAPVFLLHAFVLMCVTSQAMRHHAAPRELTLALAGAVAIRALWQGLDGIKLEGDIGPLALMILPLTVALALARIDKMPVRIVASLAAVCCLATAALTYNRATAVSFAAMVPVVIWQQRRRWWVIASLLLVLAAASVWLLSSPYRARFAEAGAELRGAAQGSVSERLDLWRAARRLGAQHPVIGIGLGRYETEVGRVAPGLKGMVAHNSYVQVAVEMGLPALAAYLTLFAAALLSAGRVRRTAPRSSRAALAGAIQVSLVAYLTAGLFISRHDMALAYVLASWVSVLACPISNE